MVSEAHVDYLGVLVNVSLFPRTATTEKASAIVAASTVPVIALTYDHSLTEVMRMADVVHPSGIQLAGNEDDLYITSLRASVKGELWKSIHLPLSDLENDSSREIAAQINRLAQIGIDKFILDTFVSRGTAVLKGGTGEKCDWLLAAAIKDQVAPFLFLAGGLNPGNVKDALRQFNPDGIDVSSGVERAPGKKDPRRVSMLVENVRAATLKKT